MEKPTKSLPKEHYRKLYRETIKILSYNGLSERLRKEILEKQAKYYKILYGTSEK